MNKGLGKDLYVQDTKEMKLFPAYHDLIPVFPFRLDEGTNPEAYIEALSLDFSDEFHQAHEHSRRRMFV